MYLFRPEWYGEKLNLGAVASLFLPLPPTSAGAMVHRLAIISQFSALGPYPFYTRHAYIYMYIYRDIWSISGPHFGAPRINKWSTLLGQ